MADAADAAAPAVRARTAVPDLGAVAVGFAAAVGMGALAAADGGYFPPAWGWTALVGLWIAAAWLVLGRVEVEAGGFGLAFLGALAGLTGWTWVSLLWTDNTVQTALEGFRVLAFLGAAAALLMVVRRATAPSLLRGVFAAIAVVSTYGLLTRLFPDRIGTYDPIAVYRLSEPLGYWNGLGAFAAMGALLGLGMVARDRSFLARCLAGAVVPLLVSVMFFTFSRGAWAAFAIGLLVAFAFDPWRLQLAVAALAVAVPSAFGVVAALGSDALTEQESPLQAAVDQGRVVALILLGCAALAAATVAAFALAERRVEPSRSVRLAFAGVLAVVALGAVGAVLVQFGGPVGLVEEAYDSFKAPPPPDPEALEQRLFTFSGSYRTLLWEEAWDDFRANPVLGSGPGTYEQYWNQNRPNAHIVRDAHSLYLETLAELGLVGFLLLLLAVGIPLVAAFGARRAPLAVGAIGAYVAYVVHAGLDWDWELTGLTVPALACAVALLALRPTASPAVVPTTSARIAGAALAVALAGVALVGLVGSSASRLSEEALAAAPPDYEKAEDEARKAEDWAPWSSEPWQRLGEAQLAQDDLAAARASFRTAIAKERTDWQLWFLLAEASTGAEQRRALAEARRLNPRSRELEAFGED